MPVRVSVSIPEAALAQIDEQRGETPRSHYLVRAALRVPGSLEDAIERVLVALEEHQREDLAMAVAVALDPDPHTTAAATAALAAMLRRRRGQDVGAILREAADEVKE